MPRTPPPKSRIKHPTLDENKFYQLFDILHDNIYEGNWSATARALGISTPTARRWFTEPPKQYWWNFVLTQVIRENIRQLRLSRNRKHKQLARIATAALARHAQKDLLMDVDNETTHEEGALKHLLIIVNEAPGQTISTRDLRKPAFSGGYSMSTLRATAKALGLKRETEGFGEDKQTYYSMPRSDED